MDYALTANILAWAVTGFTYVLGTLLTGVGSRHVRLLGRELQDGAMVSSVFLMIFTASNMLAMLGLVNLPSEWQTLPGRAEALSSAVSSIYVKLSWISAVTAVALVTASVIAAVLTGGVSLLVARAASMFLGFSLSALSALLAASGLAASLTFLFEALIKTLAVALPALLVAAPVLVAIPRLRGLGITLFVFSLALYAVTPTALSMVEHGASRAANQATKLAEYVSGTAHTYKALPEQRALVGVKVLDASGEPVPNALLIFDDGTDKPYARMTDEEGYVKTLLPVTEAGYTEYGPVDVPLKLYACYMGYVLAEQELSVPRSASIANLPPDTNLTTAPPTVSLALKLPVHAFPNGFAQCFKSGGYAVEERYASQGEAVTITMVSVGGPYAYAVAHHPNASASVSVSEVNAFKPISFTYRDVDGGVTALNPYPDAKTYLVSASWTPIGETPSRVLLTLTACPSGSWTPPENYVYDKSVDAVRLMGSTLQSELPSITGFLTGLTERCFKALGVIILGMAAATVVSGSLGGYGLSLGTILTPFKALARRFIPSKAPKLKLEQVKKDAEFFKEVVKRAEKIKAEAGYAEARKTLKLRLVKAALASDTAKLRLKTLMDRFNLLKGEASKLNDKALLFELKALSLKLKALAEEGYVQRALEEMTREGLTGARLRLSEAYKALREEPVKALKEGLKAVGVKIWEQGAPARARLTRGLTLLSNPQLAFQRRGAEAGLAKVKLLKGIEEYGDAVHRRLLEAVAKGRLNLEEQPLKLHLDFEEKHGKAFGLTPKGAAWRTIEEIALRKTPARSLPYFLEAENRYAWYRYAGSLKASRTPEVGAPSEALRMATLRTVRVTPFEPGSAYNASSLAEVLEPSVKRSPDKVCIVSPAPNALASVEAANLLARHGYSVKARYIGEKAWVSVNAASSLPTVTVTLKRENPDALALASSFFEGVKT